MTDALTNAERLLRHLAELKWMPEETAEELVAAADALAAERERRGRVTADMVRRAKMDSERDLREGETYADLEADSLNRQLAAPPLPPATGEGGSDRFERLAEEFYADTGLVAPGKDDAPECALSTTYEERVKVWKAWCKGRNRAMPTARPTTPEPSEAVVEALRSLYAEVDCRIEHGADSGGHLEFVRDKLRAALAAQEGTP